MNTRFSTALKNARKEKGLRKCEAAEIFGWTSMYYGRYENGQLLPTKYNYERFASFMNISVNQLLQLIEDEQDNIK